MRAITWTTLLGALGLVAGAPPEDAVTGCREGGAADRAGDVTGDGAVDLRDLDRVLAAGASLPDLVAVVEHMGAVPPDAPQAALPTPFVADGPSTSTSRRLAIYDGGQTGSLPPVNVVRDAATVDALGAAVAPHTPRWGRPQLRASLREWTLVRSTTQSIAWTAAGFDRGGATPMLCYFQEGLKRIDFWLGAAVDDGEPTFVLDLQREVVEDLLVGTALERPFHAYEPEAAIALPGCFLFACQRWHDVNENPSFRDWRVEGVSLVALHVDAGGDHLFEIVGDGPPLNGDQTALGMTRGDPMAMTAYYPAVEGQDPLLRAFIPVVDYINHYTIKPGGQVFLVEATRPDTRTPWSFGAFFLVGEHVEPDTHFHTAAWTPRGVVVAMGDGETLNENILYACADWDDYANPSAWTEHERVFGAGTHPDVPAETVANQFGGAVPGHDPNRLLVGGDVTGGGVYECTVPADPAEGLGFTRLWGEHWADDVTGGHVALWLHKPAPERSARSVTRVAPQPTVPPDVALDAARVLYSDDDVHFATVARLPTTTHRRSYVALHGDDILAFNRAGGTNPSPRGIWSIPAPTGRGAHRGLSIAPGGTNLLATNGGALVGATAGAGTVLTPVTDGTHPVTGAPLDAPGLGPVYRVQADGTSVLHLSFHPTGGAPVAPGFAYLATWVRVIGPEGVLTRVRLTDAGGQAQEANWSKHRITCRDQWVPYTLMFDTAAFAGDFSPQLRFLADASSSLADYLIVVDGFYAGEPPPYPIAPGAAGPAEQVTQPLGAVGATWTVGMELHVPHASEDWLGHPAASADGGRLHLATIFADADNHAELYADLEAGTVGVDIVRGGVLAGSAAVTDVAVQREDRLWVALAQSSATVSVLYAWSGGSREAGLVGAPCPAGFTSEPVEIRFGSADFSRVPSIDVLTVAAQSNRALGPPGVIELLSADEQ